VRRSGRGKKSTLRFINADKHAPYSAAIVQLKDSKLSGGELPHRPVQYLNNILKQDHRAIKRRIRAGGAQLPIAKRFI
jgi:transposase-like protein